MTAQARRSVRLAPSVPVHSDAEGVEDLSRQVRELQRTALPEGNGVTLVVTWDAPGDRSPKHGLGRVPQGWIVQRLVSEDDPVVVERNASATQITFHSTAAGVATIKVF